MSAEERRLRTLREPNRIRRLAGRDFTDWLAKDQPALCVWHWAQIDWAQAARWARRCWEDVDLTWTEDEVRAWIDARVPVDLRRAAWSFIGEPLIWSGGDADLGNGQTRYLALMGSQAETVLVSRT